MEIMNSNSIDIENVLTTQKDQDLLLKDVLTYLKDLVNCDAGTIYMLSEDKSSLEFKVVQTDTIFLDLSKSEDNIPWPNIQLHCDEGNANNINASAISVIEKKVFNVPDIRKCEEFDFEGPKAFDQYTGYDTVSMLIIPMKDSKDIVIGVIQLINKKDENGEFIAFLNSDEELIMSYSSKIADVVEKL
jgi:transcriptional regulator with GAF, ATPase, and Fis domain